jgi:hypothetical protein
MLRWLRPPGNIPGIYLPDARYQVNFLQSREYMAFSNQAKEAALREPWMLDARGQRSKTEVEL